MKAAAIILAILSAAGFSVWARAFFSLLREEKPEVKKIDRESVQKYSTASPVGFNKGIAYEKAKGVEVTMSGEMSYGDLADGIKARDP
ncbi:MAG: hypothetical protein ACRCUT_08040, partial [Spirochaetota bacterium]